MAMQADWRRWVLLLGMTAGVCIVFFLGLGLGSERLSPSALLGALLHPEAHRTEAVILWSLRLPRVLAGVLGGIGLAVSGVLLQAVTNNPMASPNIVGVNAGAGFAVMLLSCLWPAAWALRPMAAFIGAFGATMLILALSRRGTPGRSTLILAGLGCNAVLNAGISLLSLLYPDEFTSYRSFSIGGLGSVRMADLAVPAVLILLCAAAAMLLSRRIGLLGLGDTAARSLGVRVGRLRVLCLVLASASAAAVVSYAGLLGFVGLIVPHIARRLVGGRTQWLLPVSALGGAILLVLSDTLGRVLFAPTEVPVGILMAFMGAPFFLFLLLRRRRYH